MKSLKYFLLTLLLHSLLFSQSVPQNPTDTPKDQVIKIKVHNGQFYCYSPNFTKGYGYVLLSDCGYATPARYDVFQRISWKVNGAWMCLTAPSSVTGIDGKSTQKWDWLLVEPCSLNNANQRWVVKDNAFYTADGRFRIKDYQWYAFISKNSSDYYDHSLDMNAMRTWMNTIATPGNISIRTFVGWSFIAFSPPTFAVYYLQNNQSFKDDVKYLFYNPDNGHIAQFDSGSGKLYCMTSKQGKGDSWNWIAWESCTDDIPKQKDNRHWEFFGLHSNEGSLMDKNGNFLRVTQYGPNWGVPYTAKPQYLQKETSNSPKSLFVFDRYIYRWERYVNANLGEALAHCPAPGKQGILLGAQDPSSNSLQELLQNNNAPRNVRSLPPSFSISEDWIRRFWEIGVTTRQGEAPHISFCGTCLLHSFQIMAELHQNYLRGPIHTGGYFFNTGAGQDPFVSFRQRFPLLAERLETTMRWADLPLRAGETISSRTVRVNYSMTLTMLPDYHITPSRQEEDPNAIRSLINSMLSAPVGTAWIATFIRRSPSGINGHAQPVLRTANGLLFIPSNTPNVNFETYRGYFQTSTFQDATSLINFLTNSNPQNLLAFMNLRIDAYEPISVNNYMSNSNCTGLGDGRRGNLRMPSTSSVNKCGLGRCTIQ